MEKLFVRLIALAFDWLPYTVGRTAIFLVTFGSIECQPWRPITGQTRLFRNPWWTRIEGEPALTHYGARWLGAILILLLIAATLLYTFLRIMKL